MVGWTLYDLANTIFSFNILSVYFPIWVVDELGARDSTISVAFSASMVLVAVLSPLLGAVTDKVGRRLPFLVASTLGCVTATALIGWSTLTVALVLYATANLLFQLGLVFYDALLPEVSTAEDVGGVGGAGIGIGYLGSFIGLGVGAVLLATVEMPHKWIFLATAILFLVFALPCFLFVREPSRPSAGGTGVGTVLKETVAGLAGTARDLRELPGLGRFLGARFLYTDAANTLIIFLGIYTTQEIGLSEQGAQFVLAAGIAAAVVGGFLFGHLVDRHGPKPVLQRVLLLWMATLALAAAVPVLDWPLWAFYLSAVGAGLALGGTWAADRPLMLRLTPPDRVGEFYGLYGMVGRFAAVVGPLVWGGVVDGLGWGRPAAVLTLLVAIALSAVVLRGVPAAGVPAEG